MPEEWYSLLTPQRQERFWVKVDIRSEDECWLWKGNQTRDLRGVFRVSYTTVYSYRIAWYLTNGPIPPGLLVCHKCDIPLCCNPKHLFLGTNRQNMIDSAAKGRIRGGMPRSFTTEQVVEIRKLSEQIGVHEIAARYDARPSTIQQIVNYITYKDVRLDK